jgi:hypothetical protein
LAEVVLAEVVLAAAFDLVETLDLIADFDLDVLELETLELETLDSEVLDSEALPGFLAAGFDGRLDLDGSLRMIFDMIRVY